MKKYYYKIKDWIRWLISKVLSWRKEGQLEEEEAPLEEEEAQLEPSLFQQIRAKGMAGKPVVCLCGSIYGDYWAFCKDCGRRKKDLPEKCFPYGHSSERRVYKAPRRVE